MKRTRERVKLPCKRSKHCDDGDVSEAYPTNYSVANTPRAPLPQDHRDAQLEPTARTPRRGPQRAAKLKSQALVTFTASELTRPSRKQAAKRRFVEVEQPGYSADHLTATSTNITIQNPQILVTGSEIAISNQGAASAKAKPKLQYPQSPNHLLTHINNHSRSNASVHSQPAANASLSMAPSISSASSRALSDPAQLSSILASPSIHVHKEPDAIAFPTDDKTGSIILPKLVKGMPFVNGYVMQSHLGTGTFSRVVHCTNAVGRSVAIKIVRAVQKYTRSAKQEYEKVRSLMHHDPMDKKHIVRCLETFYFRSHICLVFEKLGPSLFQFQRIHNYKFDIREIKRISLQLLKAVAFLHSLTMIHTDLKPENILLMNGAYTVSSTGTKRLLSCQVKIADFGSAIFDCQHHSPLVTTRFYRSPEVILGFSWDYPVDVWSLACIFLELLNGCVFFKTHEDHEHLNLIRDVCGDIPKHVVKRIPGVARGFFDACGYLKPCAERRLYLQSLRRMNNIPDDFFELLYDMLRIDPEKRATCRTLLDYKFFDDHRLFPSNFLPK